MLYVKNHLIDLSQKLCLIIYNLTTQVLCQIIWLEIKIGKLPDVQKDLSPSHWSYLSVQPCANMSICLSVLALGIRFVHLRELYPVSCPMQKGVCMFLRGRRGTFINLGTGNGDEMRLLSSQLHQFWDKYTCRRTSANGLPWKVLVFSQGNTHSGLNPQMNTIYLYQAKS